MKITNQEVLSEDNLVSQVSLLADAGIGVIHVRTNEVVRASLALRKQLLVEGHTYKEWSIGYGMAPIDASEMFNVDFSDKGDNVLDFGTALRAAGQEANNSLENSDNLSFFVYVNPHYWFENNPIVHHFLMQYTHMLPATNVRVILITPDHPLPEDLSDSILSVRLVPPTHQELRRYLDDFLGTLPKKYTKLTEEEKDKICFAGAGMSKENFEAHIAIAIIDMANNTSDGSIAEQIIKKISQGKTEIVNKNDILELFPTEDMQNVGGMENLKEWIAKRSNCYSDEAKEFGIEPPKGIVLLGIPGTGKSLAAKAIAKEFGVPLIRLDFGRIFNSLVGKSEERIRTALAMVESMSPCVLFVDEIDKGLGGIGGSGDSGTSSRVLGSFLTWLQETKEPVFTVVTANNISGLPPELLRKGRFDELFSTGFPNDGEIKEILAIHLRKRGRNLEDFSRQEIRAVVNAAKGFVPAEIEAAIKDALINAFAAEEEFTLHHVEESLNKTIPMSVTYNKQIQEMVAWMKQNTISASKKYADVSTAKNVTKLRQRKIRKREED